jgi:acyl-CoA thioesterase I
MTNLLCTLFAAALLGLASGAHAATTRGTILFYGDSLTAGYGLDDSIAASFPGRIQEKIDAAGLPYRVINAGLSGETSAGGLRRIDWILRQSIDIFVLELGGNDGLRGLPVATLRHNLSRILDRVRAKNPQTQLVIAGMQMPRSMGSYADEFAAVFPELADEYDAILIPSLLEGVGGVPEMNLPDGVHPTAEGHRRLAKNVWQYLKPLL